MLKLFLPLVLLIQVSLGFAADPVPAPISAQVALWSRYQNLVLLSPEQVTALNLDQRKRLLKLVVENPVAALNQVGLYDPPQNGGAVGEIGYCFGRAMAAHLSARKMGLAESSMKKIFAAGDMQNGQIRWRFHMATLVLGDDNNYYAIDPIIPGMIRRYNQALGTQLDPELPVTPPMWIKLVKHFYDNTKAILEKHPELKDDPDFEGTIKFYVTDSQAIMVDMREVPADLMVENGERIIEVMFNPRQKVGFDPVFLNAEDQAQGKVGYYEVEDLKTLRRYFMIKDEPLVEQFNFFKLELTIFLVQDDVVNKVSRRYLYNGKQPGVEDFQLYGQGYFPSLMNSIEQMQEQF